MKWPWQKRPTPPQGVALRFTNGDVVPCEVFYVGKIEGLHTWEITMEIPNVVTIDRLIVEGGIPEGTAIRAKGRI